MIHIRYITGWPSGDAFIAQSPHHDGGIWITSNAGEPKQFATEADAKRYLLERKYDLPTTQVVFETVSAGQEG